MHTGTTPFPARSRAQIVVSDVSVMRGVTPVLNHVNLTLTPTSRVAIVGENGRGKSTLVHVLAGTLTPDRGSVQRVGTVAVAEQEMSASDQRTVGDAVADAIAAPLAALSRLDAASCLLEDGHDSAATEYAAALEQAVALDAWDAERRVQIALEALQAETHTNRALAELSVGQRYRVRLACLLGSDADFLLLDEPTNHLDRSGLEFLTAQIQSRKGGVIVVSHDRALLSDFARTILDLDPTPDDLPRLYGNGYAGYREGRAAERERWEQDYERQQVEQSRLQHSLALAQDRLISGWRPEKGSPKHGRATRAGSLVQSVHRRQEALDAHTISVPEPPQVFLFPNLPTRPGASLLNVDRVSVTGRLRRPVSFMLSQGGRFLVTGANGVGKSTLLRVTSGQLTPDTGEVRRAAGIRVGFLEQESSLALDRRANEVFNEHVDSLIAAGLIAESEAIGISDLGLLKPLELSKRVGELSVGQQRRLDLAIVLASRPHVLLLDEPTNHLSLTLVDELTEALGATQAAVVVSSHDRQLLRDVARWPSIELRA